MKRRAALRGPIGCQLRLADSRVINGDGWYRIVTPSSRSSLGNIVVFAALDEDVPERDIDAVVAEYRSHGVPFAWLVYPFSEPADLGDRLAARGAAREDERAMVADSALTVAVPEDVRTEVVTAASIDSYLGTACEGWMMPLGFETSVRDATMSLLERGERRGLAILARHRGELAGAAAAYVKEDGSGYLVGGSVVPRFRGRGVYRALVSARLSWLRALGITLATTHARETTSAPILAALGFETVFRFSAYAFPEPAE